MTVIFFELTILIVTHRFNTAIFLIFFRVDRNLFFTILRETFQRYAATIRVKYTHMIGATFDVIIRDRGSSAKS